MFNILMDHRTDMKHPSAWMLLVSFFVATCLALPAWSAEIAGCPAHPSGHVAQRTQPPNLGDLKIRLLDYRCFGAYDRDVAKALHRARLYVEQQARRVAKPALVLDIDETSLSNWRELIANDFGYIGDGDCKLPRGPCGVRAWQLLGQADVIAPTLALFNAAKAKGVAVFFITGRNGDEQQRAATEANLRNAGYDGWTELIMRPDGTHTRSASDFKAPERAKIEQRGFTIIANVGDQKSDLDGGHARRKFRVPNPFYYIP